MPFQKNPAWQLFFDQKTLTLTAGSDASYELDELSENEAEIFYKAWQDDALSSLKSQFSSLFQKLQKVGAISPRAESFSKPLQVAIDWLGAPALPLATTISGRLRENPLLCETADFLAADLLVLVRTHQTHKEFLDHYKNLKTAKPHLFVDLAYHHTVVIGPLVFPKQTACLECLMLRLVRNWGEEPPVAEPAVVSSVDLISGLLLQQLCLFSERKTLYHLIDRSFWMDVTTLKSGVEVVFRFLECSICAGGVAR